MGFLQNNWFSDSFDNDNQTGTPLSVNWSTISGDWEIGSNTAYPYYDNSLAMCPLMTTSTIATSVDTVGLPAENEWIGVAIRYGLVSSVQTYYAGALTKGSTFNEIIVAILLVSGVTVTILAQHSYTGVVGGVLELKALGPFLTLFLNGVQVAAATDYTLSSGQTGIMATGDTGGLAFFTAATPLENGGNCCQ